MMRDLNTSEITAVSGGIDVWRCAADVAEGGLIGVASSLIVAGSVAASGMAGVFFFTSFFRPYIYGGAMMGMGAGMIWAAVRELSSYHSPSN